MTFLGPVSTVIRDRFIKYKIQACYPRKPKYHPYKSSSLGSLISFAFGFATMHSTEDSKANKPVPK